MISRAVFLELVRFQTPILKIRLACILHGVDVLAPKKVIHISIDKLADL